MGYFLLPSVKGSKPPTRNYGGLAVKRCEELVRQLQTFANSLVRGEFIQVDPQVSGSLQAVRGLGTLEHGVQQLQLGHWSSLP
jgi:hypothetical protein